MDEFEIRLYDPATWLLLAWCKDRLPPSGVKLRDAGWTSLRARGWGAISGETASARWSYLASGNTVGAGSYPPGTVSEDVRLPNVTVSLGG